MTHLFQCALREAVLFQVKVMFHWGRKKDYLPDVYQMFTRCKDAYQMFITKNFFKVIQNKNTHN